MSFSDRCREWNDFLEHRLQQREEDDPTSGKKEENGMLILSRMRGEKIRIGDDVVIVVVEIQGDRVRLGVEAPSNVSVHRQEVYDAIRRDDGEAGTEK